LLVFFQAHFYLVFLLISTQAPGKQHELYNVVPHCSTNPSLIDNISTSFCVVYGTGFESSPHASRLMNKMRHVSGGRRRWDGVISLEQFAAFSKNNPAMLYPAFKVQRKIQTKVMGVKFWDKVLDRRILVTDKGSDFVSVKDVLNAKISEVRSVFDEVFFALCSSLFSNCSCTSCKESMDVISYERMMCFDYQHRSVHSLN